MHRLCPLNFSSDFSPRLSSEAPLGAPQGLLLSDKRTQALSRWRPEVPIGHMPSHRAARSQPRESLLQLTWEPSWLLAQGPAVTTPDKDCPFFFEMNLLRALILCWLYEPPFIFGDLSYLVFSLTDILKLILVCCPSPRFPIMFVETDIQGTKTQREKKKTLQSYGWMF